MPAQRWSALRILLLVILLLSAADYLIATIGVQISRIPSRTDFASYYFAGKLAASGTSPYDAGALAAQGYAMGYAYAQYPFLYPPPFAVLMCPLASLPFAEARALWMLLSTVCLFVALVSTVRVLHLLDERRGHKNPELVWWLMVPFVVMVLNSSVLHNDVRHGSVGAMLWMALVLMLQETLRGRNNRAGFWLAMATLLKLVPLLLLPWLYWRGGRRAAAVTLLTLGCCMIPAWIVWGPSIVLCYVRDALWPAAHLQIAWSNNVSLAALWLRLLAPLSAHGRPVGEWAPLTSVAAQGAARLSELLLVVVSILALRRSRHHDTNVHLELTTLLLLLLLVMRLTWVHTVTSMLFVYPLLVYWGTEAVARQHRSGVVAIVLASLGFFLASAHLPVLWGDRSMTWPWLLAPGLHTIGLLLLWGLSVWALQHPAQPPGTMARRVV